MSGFQPKDVIALIVLIGILTLKIRGIDGGLDTAGALILGYYFGHRASNVDNGN